MKKLNLLLPLLFAVFFASAQYCGNSGSSVCTAGTQTTPGLYPPSDSLAPFINGTTANTTIQFKNFNTIVYSGFTLTVQSLQIDTIDNLPSGLCWATNKSNNTFSNQENGCIHVSGTTCSTPGQYKLRIIVTVDVGITTQTTDADNAGLHYYVRVNNSGDTPTAVDTNQTAANPIMAYGPAANCLTTSISEVAAKNFLIYPNPATDNVHILSEVINNDLITPVVYDITGKAVNVTFNRENNNNTVLNTKNLAPGAYLIKFTVNGEQVVKRFVKGE